MTKAVMGWVISPHSSWQCSRIRQNVTRAIPRARGVQRTRTHLGEVPCDRMVTRDARSDMTILYLHGGAYVLGSAATYRHITSRLGRVTGAPVWALDYRLAPERPYPAALDDAVAAYNALRLSGVSRVAVAGDSAGAGLAVALTNELNARNVPGPAAIGLISPWVDLTVGAAERRPDAPREVVVRPWLLEAGAQAYAGAHPRRHPRISPIYGDLGALPPVVLDTGDDDLIASDGQRLQQGILDAGGSVDHRHYFDRWHVFHLLAGVIPTASFAVSDFGKRLVEASVDGNTTRGTPNQRGRGSTRTDVRRSRETEYGVNE